MCKQCLETRESDAPTDGLALATLLILVRGLSPASCRWACGVRTPKNFFRLVLPAHRNTCTSAES